MFVASSTDVSSQWQPYLQYPDLARHRVFSREVQLNKIKKGSRKIKQVISPGTEVYIVYVLISKWLPFQ